MHRSSAARPTVRPPATARRRPAARGALVALAVAALLAGACGSEAGESSGTLPEPGTTAPPNPQLFGPDGDGSGQLPEPSPAAAGSVPDPAGSGEASVPDVATPEAAAGPAEATSPAGPPVPPDVSPEAAPASPSPPPATQAGTSAARTFPAAAVWEALRQCESLGDYGFVHPAGQHFGAYQFTVATWDRLARQRYTELLGVIPSEAAPADQDRMAYYLWIESGSAPWPACSHVFSGDLPQPVADGEAVPAGTATPPPASPAGDPAPAAPDPGTAGEADPGGTGEVSGSPADDSASGSPGDGEPASPGDLPSLDIDPSVQPAIPPDVAGFPTPEQWEALRQCESTGNYQAVSRNGIYFGAYQFWPDTWDFVARRNYPRLVGVLPSAATPQDQTRMAYRLWEERGDQPWPVCGRYLKAAGQG